MIQRDNCIITGRSVLELLHSFKDFPVRMDCTTQEPDADNVADMNWWIGKDSGLIQLNPLVPLDILYSVSHGSGATGKTWHDHHIAFSKFIETCGVSNILEIGGGHGMLADNYLNNNEAKWTIIEPNPFRNNVNVRVICGMFPQDCPDDITPDAVVHSHVFEHIYNPLQFVSHIHDFLQDDGYHIFSVPNLRVMLENKHNNCLNFEHTFFLTEHYVEQILNLLKFKVVRKEHYLNDHSVFYACKKTKETIPTISNDGQYDINKEIFSNYISHFATLVKDINNKIENYSGNIYLFGGHIFSQYLIAFGLDTSKIVCILDNDVTKQGKRLYGTTLTVKSPKCITPNSAIVLQAGAYTNEIKNDILNNIDSTTTIW